MKNTHDYVASQYLDEPLTGALIAIVKFAIPAPVTYSLEKRQSMDGLPFCKRPDIDNLKKFLFDAMNGVLWKDDSQVVVCLSSKIYTLEKTGHTVLYVQEFSKIPNELQCILSSALSL